MSFNKVMQTKITFKELMTHQILQFIVPFQILPRSSSCAVTRRFNVNRLIYYLLAVIDLPRNVRVKNAL